jgi:hypothetical protein
MHAHVGAEESGPRVFRGAVLEHLHEMFVCDVHLAAPEKIADRTSEKDIARCTG